MVVGAVRVVVMVVMIVMMGVGVVALRAPDVDGGLLRSATTRRDAPMLDTQSHFEPFPCVNFKFSIDIKATRKKITVEIAAAKPKLAPASVKAMR